MGQQKKRIIVAGPCSVESYDQLRQCVEQLRMVDGLTMVRGGVWKPRTRPGAFEGLGEPALGWMARLAEEFGVTFCCEVARPEHVELCLRYGVNNIWLGARTTTNPFMVSELCAAMKGAEVNVMVKNPVCPDAALWMGGIERIEAAGARRVWAVHRGFNLYNNQGYRNAPMWEVAMELRRERPDVTILCDPSHIGGSRQLVPPIATAAMQLGYDGLMVEVHPTPDTALTDAAQQLTPDDFRYMLRQLPGADGADRPHESTLLPLREQIDTIDEDLLTLLAHRMKVSEKIAEIKLREGIAVYQPTRWKRVVADRLQKAERMGLDKEFTKELMEKIHAESIRMQLATSRK